MIPRYARAEMADIWSPDTKYRIWFEIEAHAAEEKTAAVGIAAEGEGVRVEIAKRASDEGSLYGSVLPGEIVEALSAKGIEVDRKQVDLGGGIKRTGDHPVRIDLHPEVVAEIKLTVVPEA